jgi:hypothetical protein
MAGQMTERRLARVARRLSRVCSRRAVAQQSRAQTLDLCEGLTILESRYQTAATVSETVSKLIKRFYLVFVDFR